MVITNLARFLNADVFHYDASGTIRKYAPAWDTWPDGQQGYNIHPEDPRCPVCDSPLYKTRYSYCEGRCIALCLQCETQYFTDADTRPPTLHDTRPPTQQAPTQKDEEDDIMKKYAYLIR